jgi:hypothetical protein
MKRTGHFSSASIVPALSFGTEHHARKSYGAALGSISESAMHSRMACRLVFAIALLLLASCRDAGLSAQLKKIVQEEERAAAYNKAFLSRMRSLDEKLEATNREVEAVSARLSQQEKQALSQASISEGLSRRVERINEAQVKEAPACRWAYLDKYKVERAVGDMLKSASLPAEQDPTKNPELAGKLAEYNQINGRLMQRNMPVPRSVITENISPEQEAQMTKRMEELRVPLAPYLANEQKGYKTREAVVKNALRDFAKDRFDLIVDRSFGEHGIDYKAEIPVLDVTEQLIEFIRVSQKLP